MLLFYPWGVATILIVIVLLFGFGGFAVNKWALKKETRKPANDVVYTWIGLGVGVVVALLVYLVFMRTRIDCVPRSLYRSSRNELNDIQGMYGIGTSERVKWLVQNPDSENAYVETNVFPGTVPTPWRSYLVN